MSELAVYCLTITSANILGVEAGTTGPQGGSSGCHTVLAFIDVAGTDIEVREIPAEVARNSTSQARQIRIELNGDTELDTFIEALEFAVQTLKLQRSTPDKDLLPQLSGLFNETSVRRVVFRE